jgi:hypothetical protein
MIFYSNLESKGRASVALPGLEVGFFKVLDSVKIKK